MRIYIRRNQHTRPLVIDVEPSLSVGALRKSVGAEALFLAAKSGGARFSELPPGVSASLTEPLDDAELVVAAVPPHATLTTGQRPLRHSSYFGGGREAETGVQPGSGSWQWCIKKNPTPVVTSSLLHPEQKSQEPAALEECARKLQEELVAAKVEAEESMEVEQTAPHEQLPRGEFSLLEQTTQEQQIVLASDNLYPERPEGGLASDWKELSVVEDGDVDVEGCTWNLASEIVHNALIEESLRIPEADHVSCSQCPDPFSDMGVDKVISRSSAGHRYGSHQQVSRHPRIISKHNTEEDLRESLVFAWGDNSSGQCLVGDLRRAVCSPENIPLQCVCTSLCCGDSSSLLVTRKGGLWGAGCNSNGALPQEPGGGASRKPAYVNLAELEHFDFAAVAANCEHILALTESGVLLSWSLSNAASEKAAPALPRRLSWPWQSLRRTVRIATIACGDAHSLALTDGGEVYTFGSNSKGQLGLGEKVPKSSEPALVSGKARGVPFRAVAAGMEHSMALTVSGAIYVWGNNSYGCLGLGASKKAPGATVSLPAMVPGLPGPVRYIAAGGCHSAVIVHKGSLLLTGDNSCGQLGRPLSEVSSSHVFLELSGPFGLCTRSVALGQEHSLLLTYNGELHAFGRNSEGQCGFPGWSSEKCVDRPVRVLLPTTPDMDKPLAVWAVAAGRHHNVVLCSGGPKDADSKDLRPPDSPRFLGRRATANFLPGRHWHTMDATSSPVKAAAASAPLRPLAVPGSLPCTFVVLSISWLNSLLTETEPAVQIEMRGILVGVFAQPSVLNACFCYPGLRSARLDAAGLCKALAALCSGLEGLAQELVEAAGEGLKALSIGPADELSQRDQLRSLAIYLCLPVQRPVPQANGRSSKPSLSARIAHIVMRMTASGRAAFRDVLADECGDMRVLRDFLVPQVRALADDAIRHVGAQPWLSGPLWEVVAQLQLQRALWQAVLLLQVLASACEHAALLLQPEKVNSYPCAGDSSAQSSSSESAVFEDNFWPSNGSYEDSASGTPPRAHRTVQPTRLALLDYSAFELTSLAEGCIPPELEFWLFQEHAQFHQISPTEVVDEPVWSDAAGMLPHRFCSFMAHANLAPIAFKQRVLQVENVLRQRLSQEQVLWPQPATVLGGGRADPAAFYFILTVSRQHLLRDTFAQMYSASPSELRRPLRVEFTSEEAIDEGGVMREFFRLLSAELFAPDAGLFVESDESRRLWFSPKLGPGRQLEDYWMVGVIVALAVYNNHPGMDVPLPSALFKKLKDHPTEPEDLEQLFPAQARSLEVILDWEPSLPVTETSGIDAADCEFSDTFCMSFCLSANEEAPETALCDGGLDRPVLFSDREEFASCVHEHLLHKSVQPQFESFARGFRRVCNSPLFDVLSPLELEAIVAGDKDLDFGRLRMAVQYEGYAPDEEYVQNFWTVLETFDTLRRRRFLAFCTGSDVAPAGGLQDLHLLIQKHGSEPTMRLPVAHTCFNLLLLPHYSSVEKLHMMLVTAIEWTEGFGLQ